MMRNDSTIPIKSNSISVYICRRVENRMQILLLDRDTGSEDNWGITFAQVKPMEMCWQAALNEVRTDTGAVPDRIYSVDHVETFYDVKLHAVMLSPVFVAFFDHGQDTKPILPNVKSMWLDASESMVYLALAHQRDIVKMINKEFFAREPSEDLKVYPTRF